MARVMGQLCDGHTGQESRKIHRWVNKFDQVVYLFVMVRGHHCLWLSLLNPVKPILAFDRQTDGFTGG